jgi:hypothetical protein
MAPGPLLTGFVKVDRRQSQPLLGSESSKVRQNESPSPFGSCFIDGRSLFLRGDRGWNQDFEVWQEGVGSKYWRMLATPMTHQVKGKSLDLYIQSRLVEAPVRMQLSCATAPAFVAVEDAVTKCGVSICPSIRPNKSTSGSATGKITAKLTADS